MRMLSRKVFFLYPINIIEDKLIKDIVANQYEAYAIHDHVVINDIISNGGEYNNSILFLNFDKKVNNIEWSDYIESINENPETTNVLVNSFSINTPYKLNDEDILTFAPEDLELNYNEFKMNFISFLDKINAMGRRNYLRIKCFNKYQASCSIKVNKEIYKGEIIDLSIAGILCTFDKNPYLDLNYKINDFQLRLHSNIINCSGRVHGMRNENSYVILFEDCNIKKPISDFVHYCIQKDMKNIVKHLNSI